MSKKEDGKEGKTDIVIVVSGTAVTLNVSKNQPLKSLVEKALEAAEEASDPAQWGFFIEQGKEMVDLDGSLKVEEVLERGLTIYLNKKAGAAG